MYTKRPIQPSGEPLRLPEHYSGVAFSHKGAQAFQTSGENRQNESIKNDIEESKEDPTTKEETCPSAKEDDSSSKKENSLLGIGGREDILLLILALLLLDDKGGDDMLAYILLGLLFLG